MGCCNPTARPSTPCSTTAARNRATEARFRDIWPTRSVARVSRTHDPAATTTLYAPPPHPYATSPVAFSCGATETEPQRFGFGLWSKNPLPASRFTIARPHHHHHLVQTTTPSIRNVIHRRFTRRNRNRATAARFRTFDQNPLPASHFANARPHHLHYLVQTTTSPLPTVLCCRSTRHARNRAPAARFRILAPNPLPASHFANAPPHHHHHLIRPTAPPPFTALHLHFHWRARN
jgi:hypothetical protein